MFFKNRDLILANVLRNSSCGHLFECLEYYYLFKTTYLPELARPLNPCIYLAYDNFNKEIMKKIIEYKYSFTEKEIQDILDNTYIESISDFCNKKVHDFRDSKNIVFVEAYDLVQIKKLNILVACENLIGLRCAVSEKDFELIDNPITSKVKIFQDYRVYGNKLHNFKTKNHVKKILFNKLKLYKFQEQNSAFIYISTDCRNIKSEYLQNVLKTYSYFNKIYVSVLDKSIFENINSEKIIFLEQPIKDFHSLFDTMIYLPVKRKFDCSSRLIPECIYYGKKVIYHDINYEDSGLSVRRSDSDRDISELQLTSDDILFKEVGENCLI